MLFHAYKALSERTADADVPGVSASGLSCFFRPRRMSGTAQRSSRAAALGHALSPLAPALRPSASICRSGASRPARKAVGFEWVFSAKGTDRPIDRTELSGALSRILGTTDRTCRTTRGHACSVSGPGAELAFETDETTTVRLLRAAIDLHRMPHHRLASLPAEYYKPLKKFERRSPIQCRNYPDRCLADRLHWSDEVDLVESCSIYT